MGNLYDNLVIDIEKAHENINAEEKLKSQTEHYLGLTDKVLYKSGYYQKMIDSGLKRGWFDEFSEYWIKALGARPLKFHDFFIYIQTTEKSFRKLKCKRMQMVANSWKPGKNQKIFI